MSQPPSHHGAPTRASEALLRSARSDHAPNSADRERVRRALAKRLAESTATLPEATATPEASPTRALLHAIAKTGIGLVLVAGGITALLRISDRAEAPALTAPASLPVVHDVAETQLEETTRGNTGPAENTVAPKAAPREQSDPSKKRAASRSRATPRAAKAASSSAAVSGGNEQTKHVAFEHVGTTPSEPADMDTSAQPGPSPTATVLQAQVRGSERATTKAEPKQHTDKPVARAEETAANGREELAFLTRIRAKLLEAEHEHVLEMCDEHEQRWPHGIFAQEREALRAIATCQTASSKATETARAFFTRYPESPMLPRVRAACAPQLKAATTRRPD